MYMTLYIYHVLLSSPTAEQIALEVEAAERVKYRPSSKVVSSPTTPVSLSVAWCILAGLENNACLLRC